MARKALGLIETMGLVAALGAADAALKAANVSLIGFDFPGNGGTTVKLEGEVSAVKSAVDAGVSSAERIYKVLSWYVIPRPDDGMESIIMDNPKKLLFAEKSSLVSSEKVKPLRHKDTKTRKV
jgi:microcompartment protein CcmL/EutN